MAWFSELISRMLKKNKTVVQTTCLKDVLIRLISLSLRFNSYYPGEPGLAGVYWSKGWWRWWWQLDYWSCKSCSSQIITTNKPTSSFFTGWMPFLSPNQQCQSTEAKMSHIDHRRKIARKRKRTRMMYWRPASTQDGQVLGDATVLKRFFRDNFIIFQRRSKRIAFLESVNLSMCVYMQLFYFLDGHMTTFRHPSWAYIFQMPGHRLSRLGKGTPSESRLSIGTIGFG